MQVTETNDKFKVDHEQGQVMDEEQEILSAQLIPPDETIKDFSCRCGTVFENQEDLNDHVMNSSYCYDFYMYHDN